MMNKLCPIVGKKTKQVKFMTADIEAYDWIKFLVIGLYDGHNNHYKYFTKLSKFLDYAYEYAIKHEMYEIFCHFGGKYDFNFIIQEVCESKYYSIADIIPRGSGILSFRVFKRDACAYGIDGKEESINFRDSAGLLPMALRSLAKSFGVEVQKGDIDYLTLEYSFANKDYTQFILDDDRFTVFYNGKEVSKVRKNYNYKKITYFVKGDKTEHRIYNREDVLFYLEKDCKAQWQVLKSFFDWPLVVKAGQCFTTASQAVKIWQTFLESPVYSLSKSVDEFVRRAYFGGRTEVFRPVFDGTYDIKKNPFNFGKKELKYLKEQHGKELYCYDINSLYPTVMLENEYPIKCNGFCFGSSYDPNELGVWEVEVDVPKDMFMPPLPYKYQFPDKTEKLIFPTGRFKGYFTNVEIEYARSLGVKIINIECGYTFVNGGKIFESFIGELYAMRLVAKRTGDGVTNLLTKLIMNSCYGRLGLNTSRENIALDVGQLGVKPHSEIKTANGMVRFVTQPVELENAFTNVAISCFVTSYARIKLHKTLVTLGKDIYYCDTDSVFTTRRLPTGDELGLWKEEYHCKSACFLLPKTYFIGDIFEDGQLKGNKIAMKGFDKKKIQHFQFEDFVETLIGEKEKLKIIQEPKFATLKTAIKKGFFVCMNFDPELNRQIDERKEREYISVHGKRKKFVKKSYEKSTRQVKALYDKRVLVDNNFMTVPHNLKLEK